MGGEDKTCKTLKDAKTMMREARRSLNVNEEYLGALRTKSYGEFFMKAHELLVNNDNNNNQPLSPNSQYTLFSDILLEPAQEKITNILESTNIFPRKYNLKPLLSNYFHISAKASKFCSQLLKTINQVQNDYDFVDQILESIDDKCSSHQFNHLVLELRSYIIHNNPFSNLKKQDFALINDEYSSILHHLSSKRQKVARKIKFIKFINKASGVFVTTACGVLAVAAVVLAAHTLVALVMGPAIFIILPLKRTKINKLTNHLRFLKCGFLSKIGAQLDVAAKGTYILNRDFDTMSRLVDRLHDEIEHNKAMIKLCLDRREDSISFKVLKELKKSNVGFRKQVEELEEHVYLCLLTINRASTLVINEIGISCG